MCNWLTYKRIFILLHLLVWCGGMSAFNVPELAEEPDTVPSDSLRQQNRQAAAMLEIPLDTAGVLRADSVRLDSVSQMTFGRKNRENFQPDPIRSMWIALVLPGGGQIYNRKYWKLPIIYGGFLGCVYALTWNNQMLRDYSQAYLDIMDDDPNTASYMEMLPMGYDITGKEERFQTIFKNKKNYYRKFRDLSVFAFVGVYAISVLDAYIDAELSSFDITEDLSLHWEPAVIGLDYTASSHFRPGHKSYGVTCALNF